MSQVRILGCGASGGGPQGPPCCVPLGALRPPHLVTALPLLGPFPHLEATSSLLGLSESQPVMMLSLKFHLF